MTQRWTPHRIGAALVLSVLVPAQAAAQSPTLSAETDLEPAPAATESATPQDGKPTADELRVLLDAQQAQLDAQKAELAEVKKQLAAQETDSTESDAEVAAVMASVEAEGSTAQADFASGRPLRVYGFLDFGFQKFFVPKRSVFYPLISTHAGTFSLGNVNLFFDASPREDWRALMEIRFTNVPHGQDVSYANAFGGEYERNNRVVFDTESSSGFKAVLLGNIILERALIEWSPIDAFNLQGGLWLTPFGIWNVDHGSPTLISLLLPALQVSEYAPSRQLGLHAKGSVFPTQWELGYHAYVSNGRTPGEHDLTEDKALGGRLFASRIGEDVRSTVGVSGYYGTYVDEEKRVASVAPLQIDINRTVEGREWAVGVDLAVDVNNAFRLRTEGAVRRREYEPGKRPPAFDVNPAAVAPDTYELNGYVLGAYRLPWLGLEPYVWFEALHGPSSAGDTALVPSVGLNVHFSPEAQLKIQYARVYFADTSTVSERTPSDNDFSALLSRMVLAF